MIYKASPSDAAAVSSLALKLWPEHEPTELRAEFEALLRAPDAAVFLCLEDDTAIGFAQCQLRRDYVEGCESSPVGYLEGIFIEEDYRLRGCAKKLLRACEAWSRSMGCSEFASDCESLNLESIAFHRAAGFEKENTIVCFAKKL